MSDLLSQDQPLPCPFCGKPGEAYPDGDMEGYNYSCWNMDCCYVGQTYATDAEALRAWNTRAIPPVTDALRAGKGEKQP